MNELCEMCVPKSTQFFVAHVRTLISAKSTAWMDDGAATLARKATTRTVSEQAGGGVDDATIIIVEFMSTTTKDRSEYNIVNEPLWVG